MWFYPNEINNIVVRSMDTGEFDWEKMSFSLSLLWSGYLVELRDEIRRIILVDCIYLSVLAAQKKSAKIS